MEQHTCLKCSRTATYKLVTQFAGTHHYCDQHARINAEFADMVAINHNLEQLAAAEAQHDSNGYQLSNQTAYEVAAKIRAESLAETLGLEPPPTHEELLHELWYLRRRVKQLERQVFEMGWQISGESMGR